VVLITETTVDSGPVYQVRAGNEKLSRGEAEDPPTRPKADRLRYPHD